MIITVRDVNGSGRIVNETTAAMAASAAYSGYNVLVLQLTNDSYADISDILYREDRQEDDGYYTETGIDALLNEAAAGMLTKETFYAVTKGMTRNRRCDVTPPSNSSSFYDTLKSSVPAFKAMLASAGTVYDIVYIPLRTKSEEDLFGDSAQEISALFDANILLVRQGGVEAVTKHYPHETYVVTGYRPESKYSIRVMARKLGIGRTPICPLSVPTGCRDSIDEGRLLLYVRSAKAEEEDPCAASTLWSGEIADIIASQVRAKAQAADVWTVMDYDGDDAPVTGNIHPESKEHTAPEGGIPQEAPADLPEGAPSDVPSTESSGHGNTDEVITEEIPGTVPPVPMDGEYSTVPSAICTQEHTDGKGFRNTYIKRPTRRRRG